MDRGDHRRNLFSFQIISAGPSLPFATRTAFKAPTDVPAIAVNRSKPISWRAFHAPIWYAPLNPPPARTSPTLLPRMASMFRSDIFSYLVRLRLLLKSNYVPVIGSQQPPSSVKVLSPTENSMQRGS